MTRAPRPRHPCGDAGQITAFVVVMMAALILLAGLVLDGGLTLDARERALGEAQEAARVGKWVAQQARNLMMSLNGHADGSKFLIRNRDAKFIKAFDAVLTAVGTRTIRTPVRAPRANAIAEGWIASPPRVPGPGADRRRTAPSANAERVNRSPQLAPAASGAVTGSPCRAPASACPRWKRPGSTLGPARRPVPGPARRPDRRILAGRMR